MTNSDYWWEPPIAGTETEHIVGALDRLRTAFRWKADDLDTAGLQTRIGDSRPHWGKVSVRTHSMVETTIRTCREAP